MVPLNHNKVITIVIRLILGLKPNVGCVQMFSWRECIAFMIKMEAIVFGTQKNKR